jgi:hypothetical protein
VAYNTFSSCKELTEGSCDGGATEVITLTNNLFVFDEVPLYGNPIDDAFEQATNLVIYTDTEDPGLFNPSGTGPMDANLVAGAPPSTPAPSSPETPSIF